MISNGTKKKGTTSLPAWSRRKTNTGRLAGKTWVFERTRCSDESKNKQTTRDREKESVVGGVTRGTMQGQKIYDNNSIRTGCIGIQQREEYFPFGMSWGEDQI